MKRLLTVLMVLALGTVFADAALAGYGPIDSAGPTRTSASMSITR